MENGPNIAQVAALIGDPSRANMLSCLMDGRASTASELAYVAHVSASTASGHLAKLSEAGLIMLEVQGRHRYFRLASPLVGQLLEGLMAVADAGPIRRRPHWRGGDALGTVRTCYDHLAGRVAVAIADALVARDHVVLHADGGEVTPSGHDFFARMGIELQKPSGRRIFCRPCLDWSERRPHIAGAVGAAICRHSLNEGWLTRVKDSRALAIAGLGREALATLFGIAV